MTGMVCPICAGGAFHDQEVLWPALIAEWQLAPDEVRYVNRQQGTCCTGCGANLRSMALAKAVLGALAIDATLSAALEGGALDSVRILEINEAGHLTPFLSRLPTYTIVRYPDVDMMAMPLPDGQFDLVVHSDTLEHVAQPKRGLAECRRVLRAGGSCCFTVPVIVGRLTRDRSGLPPSHHGNPGRPEDNLVHTEFGADVWTLPLQAGFSSLSIHAMEFPSALAFAARR